ncbi:MAG TPA: GspH/FimT family protein [Desulfosalsimonadaceae bacterium]|nr:GspH/FimT family protein [Desulfosalsimonadaceae bacterium]
MPNAPNAYLSFCKGETMHKKGGFTLIEMMIAIAIFAILAAIATPNAITWYRNAQFNSAVREVKTKIEGVRMFAVKNNSQAEVTFPAPGGSNNSFQTDKWNRGTNTHQIQTHNLQTGITVSYDNNPLQYNSRGMAANIGTITIQNNAGLCREIEISRVGSSRIERCP